MARTTKVKASEESKSEAVENVETEESTVDSAGDDEILTPIQVKETPKAPSKPRRDLGGLYKTKNQVRFNGVYQNAGSILTLTDSEARHFLKFNAVEAIDDE